MDEARRRPTADPTLRFFREIMVLVVLAVVVATGGVYWRTSTLIGDRALGEARSCADLIITTRSWNALYGGVWVVEGPGVETNPYLKALGVSADTTTTDGRTLTLRNPAIMTREISSMLKSTNGTAFRLTSLKPVNPANTPDPWERSALLAFDTGSTELWESVETSAGPVLRYTRPLMTDASCLKCHARQGYRVGDVRGAVSVIVPLKGASSQVALNALLLGLLGLAAAIVLLGVTNTLFTRLRGELRRAQTALVEAATVDHLTRAATSRHTIERLHDEIERARRTGEPLGLVMLDVDHFKNVNDTLGHAAGDTVLAAVAERTATAMRPYDLLGRIGGEEFLIIAPAADLDGAASIAERTRARISASPIGDGADAIRVTASFGVTLVVPDEPEALDRALARADAAMYESKDTGRDRVSVRPHDGSERS